MYWLIKAFQPQFLSNCFAGHALVLSYYCEILNNTETLSQQPRQELSSQTSVLLNMVNTMSSLVKQVLDKQEGKDDVGRQTLDAFSTNRTQMHTGTCNISDTNLVANENFGIHPEQIRNIDFVTETVRDKILSGKYVNGATLLIYHQLKI